MSSSRLLCQLNFHGPRWSISKWHWLPYLKRQWAILCNYHWCVCLRWSGSFQTWITFRDNCLHKLWDITQTYADAQTWAHLHTSVHKLPHAHREGRGFEIKWQTTYYFFFQNNLCHLWCSFDLCCIICKFIFDFKCRYGLPCLCSHHTLSFKSLRKVRFFYSERTH